MRDRVIEDLQRAFVETQAGWYLAPTCRSDGAIVFSDLITDEYWNYVVASPYVDIDLSVQQLVAEGRRAAVYLTPADGELEASLLEGGFELLDREAVMCLAAEHSDPPGDPTPLAIDLVRTADQIERLLEVFEGAHAGDADDLYGTLPPEYTQCLRRSIGRPNTWHYLGHLAGEPVALGSMASTGKFFGLYNAGVLPAYRRRGFGTAMLWHRVRQAQEMGGQHMFLQTVAGEHVERRYQRYGFETAYVGRIYVRHQTE